MSQSMRLTPGSLTLAQLRQIYHGAIAIELDPACYKEIERSQQVIQQVLDRDEVVYGINTGFGLLANTRIEHDQLETLQRSIVLSHSAGVGEPMSEAVVRLMMALKINSLARGFSGIRLSVIEALVALYNQGVYPVVPSKGSVGASGDLAPLAHMSSILLGEGEVFCRGERLPAVKGLQMAGLKPLTLAPKEGLALLNGTQASTAFALRGLFAAENLFAAGMVTGALSVEAALGSRKPFDDRIHAVRGHKAQRAVAACYRELLSHSEIEDSHACCDRVQDPYSLRCQPQVMGACLQQIEHAASVLEVEANGVSDNPLIFADEGEILSGGNFHAEPVAMAADNLALAIAEIGSLSERRMALLIDSHLSQLPPFLVDNGGVNSGFMIAQVTSAALASENKSLAHPASVDSLPTSANQEDHVSMATFAARRLGDMADNTEGVLAVELLAACQGLDFRKPLKSSDALELARSRVRERVPFYDKDRYFADDIAAVAPLIQEGVFNTMMSSDLLPSLGD
ncbi:histidine ammonia-lyase [Aestuariirhabdus sp. Z084]|uniref:histidine ammonia-lyase n=1 Tax=Aestuariirhabdus haliotis TaxID=2918751 RepID=UPI00201B3E7B|nr:histidine ammonia-lyase [Aestuariirhabdus haliotis]MCL6415033.1 histidine ammonia-lyase [Aestuariirhabdus haliotis]MCL6418965.1 histidine ammonia-lyase [Aestuariirhabdus haliotis]